MDIRPTKQQDIAPLKLVLDETGLFPSEVLPQMLSSYFSQADNQDIWLTCEAGGEAVGFCYCAPEALTDGTWNMLAIAVRPQMQSKGAGGALIAQLESQLREQGQRVLIVDTSSAPQFERTRTFYKNRGYSQEARIREYWAKGDDKIVFWKSLN